ncbi:helix-turn-helix domain-containing protein [Sphingosinicella sp. BN140058]|uniref:helix-turn-helix domain-containing protein n=1 Tax=Sphingosinicella sp. BN140058 TaxID=1892855 RepID=UPI001011AD80|nr:helix-turn-helix transcriptional regulator [Sphingosinicella sp. BN140058]QAY75296.1 XRE family transcriptional regulator [Sphingosinicella sp. BN140058]
MNGLPSLLPSTPLGDLLRDLRAAHGVSQLDLALRCEISPRHLSYVETGKAQPSRDVVERIGEELDLPLRDRNALYLAAGYAPRYRQTPLEAPELAVVREAIEATLGQQEPYPAFVFDRHWTVMMANRGMTALMEGLIAGGPRHANILHQIFDPDDLRSFIVNWDEVAGDLLRHLRHEVQRSPYDLEGRALLDALLAYPDIPAAWHRTNFANAPLPMVRTVFKGPEGPLSFLSTMTQFGTAWDLTIEEIRVEAMHPTDEATRAWCRAQA